MSHDVGPATSGAPARPRTTPIRDWVKLAVTRARLSGTPAIFWLDSERAHDRNPHRPRSRKYLADQDTDGLDITIASPRGGQDLPSSASARRGHHLGHRQRPARLQHRPLPDPRARHQRQDALGGPADERWRGLFETGAGGSAPKHVQQLVAENYLRWDSLGEFLALAESLRHEANKGNERAGRSLADTLDAATEKLLDENKSPPVGAARSTTEAATSGSPTSGPRSLPGRPRDADLAAAFRMSPTSSRSRKTPSTQSSSASRTPVDIGGYYRPDNAKASEVMRPSATFNRGTCPAQRLIRPAFASCSRTVVASARWPWSLGWRPSAVSSSDRPVGGLTRVQPRGPGVGGCPLHLVDHSRKATVSWPLVPPRGDDHDHGGRSTSPNAAHGVGHCLAHRFRRKSDVVGSPVISTSAGSAATTACTRVTYEPAFARASHNRRRALPGWSPASRAPSPSPEPIRCLKSTRPSLPRTSRRGRPLGTSDRSRARHWGYSWCRRWTRTGRALVHG